MAWGKKNKIASYLRKKPSWDTGKKVSTVVDNVKHEDIRSWAHTIIGKAMRARDRTCESSNSINSQYSTGTFKKKMLSNYRLYVDMKSELVRNGTIGCDEDAVIKNSLQKNIRAKVSMFLMSVPAWKYEAFDTNETGAVDAFNQILNQRLVQEYYEATRMDLLLKQSIFGSAIGGYIHDASINEYDGGKSYFVSLDPLSCAWSFGSKEINGSPDKRTAIFIVVRPRRKGDIERDYGIKVKSGNDLVNLDDWNLQYADANIRGYEFDEDVIPEVQIWYDDLTTINEVVEEPLIEEAKDPITNALALNEDGSPIIKPVLDELGDPVMKKVSTGTKLLKYPNGRLIVFAGATTCYDDINPYAHGLRPYFKQDNVSNPVGFWAVSDTEIGESLSNAATKLRNSFHMNVKNMPGIVEIKSWALSNPEKKLTEHPSGFYMAEIDQRHRDVRDVVKYQQPSAFSQDQYLLLQDCERSLGDVIGVQMSTIGRSYASESGEKMEIADSKTLRFHRASMLNELMVIQDLGKMWISNLRQFDKVEKLYSVIGRDGLPEREVFAGAMLDKEYPLNVIPHILAPSHQDMILSKLIEMKGTGIVIPDEVAYDYSNIPELQTIARATKENRKYVTDLLMKLEEAGMLDDLLANIQNMQTDNTQPNG